MRHLAALDGLRGLAVIAVILYHAGVLPGGFIGVEIFFVLSGFLITSLLRDEWTARRKLDIAEFWRRRARRLLPASTVMVVVTLTMAAIFLPSEVATTRASAAASVLWISNWYSVLSQQSYFEAIGRPPLLRHLWSLAIEAQFYAAWPVLLMVGLRWTSLRGVAVLALGGALASAVVMSLVFQPGIDPSRAYYGTDTRASGLLVGAALALSGRSIQATNRFRRLIGEGVGLLGVGVLGVTCYVLNEFDPHLYRGGFLVVDLITVLVIASIGSGNAFLGWWPLRWIGERSYGIYLWHWPVFMLTRPRLDVPLDGPLLVLMQLLCIGLLASISYRFVEMPFRRGGVRMQLGVKWAALAGSALTAAVLWGTSSAAATPVSRPVYLPADRIDTWDTHVVSDASPVAQAAVSAPVAEDTPSASTEPVAQAPLPPSTPAVDSTEAPHVRVTAIGDSVMLGAASALSRAIVGIEIDAAISRQAATFIDILRARAATGDLGDVIVVHVGNNGPLSLDQFDAMMDVLAPVGRVVLVTVKVPRAWESPNNAILRDGVARYSSAVLADWKAESSSQPDLFWDDGIHLRAEGAAAYAAMIAEHALR